MFDPENIKVCFEVFSRITRELSSAHDVGEVLDHMARQTAAATGAKGCAIRLLNEKTGFFELSAVRGLSQEYLKKGPIDANHSLTACINGEIVQILNTAEDPRVQYPEDAKAEGIVSILSVPMVMVDRTIGVLRLYSSEPRVFTEDELAFVCALSDLGVLALHHARRYSGLKVDHDSLVEDFQVWFESRGDTLQ